MELPQLLQEVQAVALVHGQLQVLLVLEVTDQVV
jgi:hypothetical protein